MATLAAALLPCLALAQPPAAPTEPAEARSVDEVITRIQTLVRIGEPNRTQDLATCRVLLEPWREPMFRERRGLLEAPLIWLAFCHLADRPEGQSALSEPEVRAWLAPWRETSADLRDPDPLQTIKWVTEYDLLLQHLGLRAAAAPIFEREVHTRIERLRAQPGDRQTSDELTWLSRRVFGMWLLQDQVRTLHGWYEQGLGPGHYATLQVLRAMAYHERVLGRAQRALQLIERAVALTRGHQAGDAQLAAHMATEHAACLATVGRLAEGQQRMLQARAYFAGLAPGPGPVSSLQRIDANLASTALAMGDLPAAITHAENAIAEAERSGHRTALYEAHLPHATRAVARMRFGDAAAAQTLKQTLESATTAEQHLGSHALALVDYAVQHGDAALLQWAAAFLDQHIRKFRSPLHADQALRPLLQAWQAAGASLQAAGVRPALTQALAIALTRRSPNTLALTEFSLARHLVKSDPDTAIWLYKSGANALQQLRSGLPGDQPELHRAWLGTHERDLRAFIGLLIDQGRLIEAEQALAALRDEESHEYSRRAVRQRIAEVVALSYTAAESLRNQGLDAATRMAVQAAEAADTRLEAWTLRALRTDYHDPAAQTQIAELASFVQQLIDQAPAAQRGLAAAVADPSTPPRGQARLTYFVRDEAIELVLQQGRLRQRITLATPRVEVNRMVQAARAALNTPQQDALPALRALYDALLRPAETLLRRGGATALQITPDAALRYVPFAALHDGQRFVAERFVLSARWAGSAAVPAVDERLASGAPRRQGGVVALGRTESDATHAALPGVAQELAVVRARGNPVWLDRAFTSKRLRQALEQGPDVVHLASHFVLDPGGEDKSYLLLGDGSRLSLAALAALPWRGVRLALLSACDSGVAVDASGAGQALVGFASTLQQAGVDRVLATLWRVSDGATAKWMAMFYRASPAAKAGAEHTVLDAAAVARTQRQWLARHKGQALAHPHYWAAFTWLAWD